MIIAPTHDTILNLELEKRIGHLTVSQDAKCYIAGVLFNFVKPTSDEIITESVVLQFINAQDKPEFHKFQYIADWLLWIGCVYPSTYDLHGNTYTCIAQTSYHRCWIMMNRSWPVFKELADDIQNIVSECKKIT